VTTRSALLLIDVVSDFDFHGGDELAVHALAAARRLARLRERVRGLEAPIVYVNDNFGKWRSDFAATLSAAAAPKSRGRQIAELLAPGPDDYFVLKPRHSGFFGSPLEILLQHLEVSRLVIGGWQTHMCVLFTAADAHMRGFELVAPEDCSAAASAHDHAHAMRIIRETFSADVRRSEEISDQDLRG
jgi:nicotinamidase-related amidase